MPSDTQNPILRATQLARLLINFVLLWMLIDSANGQDISQLREWMDVSGRFKTEAALVKMDDGSVKLRVADGREVSLPFGRLSETDRDYDSAVRILQQSAKQYEDLNAHLHADNLHRQTLSSTYNNLAVISARKRSESGFVNYLRISAKTSAPTISFATHHNVFVALSDKTISANFRKDLTTVLAGGMPQPGPAGPQRLAYALDHDSFEISADGQALPPDSTQTQAGLVRTGSGSAFLISPELALINRHVAEGATSFTVRNDSGFESSATMLVVSNDPRVDLALLRLDAPAPASISVLPVALTNAREQEELMLLGYPIPDILEATVTSSGGSVSKYIEGGLAFIHEASSDPGSSGGPCINLSGEVIGVHFAGNLATRNVRNHAVSPTAIRQFLAGARISVADRAQALAASFADVFEESKDAVLFVEVYGLLSDSDIPPERESSPAPLVLYDDCCLMCSGSGMAKCRSCINGFLEKPYVVVIRYNFDGTPVNGQKFAKVKCPHCDLGGHFRCPLCGGSGNAK